jgi:hypothetical protein
MSMHVLLCFELRDECECDRIFAYLAQHPKDMWDYEQRVQQNFHLNFHAHWTHRDVLHTEVSRFRVSADAHMIQYKITLRAGASDPRLLVDMLRRCGGVQEGVVRAHWRVLAWYNREGEAGWAADAGNGGGATRHCVRVLVLLCRLRQLA